MEHYSRPQPAPIVAPCASVNSMPLTIITMLFFMWGLLTSLNDVLIPHLKSIYTLSYVQAMLVQFCFFGAYFIASLPAGMLVRRIGYQRGVVAGLVTAAAGCALFYPAATSGYAMFLAAFFVLACGVTILQVAANPYVTVLGDPAGASRRLTLTQAFNSLGTTLAPVLGGMLILGAASSADRNTQIAAVQGPYLYLALALLTLAVLFALVRLPRIVEATAAQADGGSLLTHRRLVLGAVGIFMYVGAEVSVGSFLINYLGESRIAGLRADQAAHYVGLYWGGAMLGRFIGVAIMRSISPGTALAFTAASSILLILLFGVQQRTARDVVDTRRRPVQLHHVSGDFQHGAATARAADGTWLRLAVHGYRRRRHRAFRAGVPGRQRWPASVLPDTGRLLRLRPLLRIEVSPRLIHF